MNLPLDEIAAAYGIGKPAAQPEPVTSGLVNTVFRLRAAEGAYILKVIDRTNPRARTRDEYRGIEILKRRFADDGLPVVPALRQNGDSLYPLDGKSDLIVFPRIDADTICPPTGPMPPASCVAAGDILGRMHALGLTRLPGTPPFPSTSAPTTKPWPTCSNGSPPAPLAGTASSRRTGPAARRRRASRGARSTATGTISRII